jgi:mRNA interferase HigB
VRVISRKALREFWAVHPAAQPPLLAWYKLATAAAWRTFAALRATFGSADRVGDCVVFDIGGNKFRLIGRVRYTTARLPGVVYVLKVMTHAEYDDNTWPDECGCHDPPPKRKKGKPGGARPVRRPRTKG